MDPCIRNILSWKINIISSSDSSRASCQLMANGHLILVNCMREACPGSNCPDMTSAVHSGH